MKKFLSFLVFSAFIITIAIFISCDKKNDNDNPVIPDPGIFTAECGRVEINSEEYIQLCIVPNIVTANSTNKYRIENHSKRDLFYGVDFALEFFDNNNWIPIDLNDIHWEEIGISTKAGDTDEHSVGLYWFVEKFNSTKAGKYRIIKSMGKGLSIPAEFIVKKEDTNLLP